MPAFSTSLGCLSAPYIYKSSKISFTVPIGAGNSDHTVDIRGGAVGTFTMAEGDPDSSGVQFELTIRTDDESLLDQVSVDYPISEESAVINSRLSITMPYIESDAQSCMRFDLTMYVPPTLRKLQVAAQATTQVQYDPESHIALDELSVILHATDINNMILPHAGFRATNTALEVYRGWIVGEASIANSTAITTTRGDGVANVRILPAPPAPNDDISLPPATAYLQTLTGAGRTDIVYVNNKAYPHRPISSSHTSSRNGDMYLTYSEAEYNGYVNLLARSYTARGLQSIGGPKGHGKDETRTHWAGDKEGGDQLSVKSSGWAGLYF